ncbi:esterase/lipase family protein [Nocardia bovistercoris]|uniref:Alpha/beta fold hydrolase n=1 Tax=Nocardia bovistercoris TaxID=2785916 RepID=A0A931IC12_9NOCA|nr:alpha/beta fold hydrolase [Nocardia bovistercoris]MBH0777781.1 alpha/beta fold hydrolase [Nocardia bovistercoris]
MKIRATGRSGLRRSRLAAVVGAVALVSGVVAGTVQAAPVTTTPSTTAPSTSAAPPAAKPAGQALTEQDLVDTINADGKAKAVAESGSASGSSSGSASSSASDTVGYGPEMTAWTAAYVHGLSNPNVAPPGTNDWKCKPTAAHPRPVIAVHGTFLSAYNTYAYMSKPIKDAGFCVFTFNYGKSDLLQGGGIGALLPGTYGTGDIPTSAKQLGIFVDRVLAATGASKVDLIGHSQGGSMSSYYTKYENGASKVQNLIALGATFHGTDLDGIAGLGRAINNIGIDVLGIAQLLVGQSGIQQTIGSDFIKKLNANGDTVSGIEYTVIGTRNDEITTPWDSTFLKAGPGATVHNITLQDGCGDDGSDHLTMMYSPRALSIVLRALDPAANPNLKCTFNPWLIGGGGRL